MRKQKVLDSYPLHDLKETKPKRINRLMTSLSNFANKTADAVVEVLTPEFKGTSGTNTPASANLSPSSGSTSPNKKDSATPKSADLHSKSDLNITSSKHDLASSVASSQKSNKRRSVTVHDINVSIENLKLKNTKNGMGSNSSVDHDASTDTIPLPEHMEGPKKDDDTNASPVASDKNESANTSSNGSPTENQTNHSTNELAATLNTVDEDEDAFLKKQVNDSNKAEGRLKQSNIKLKNGDDLWIPVTQELANMCEDCLDDGTTALLYLKSGTHSTQHPLTFQICKHSKPRTQVVFSKTL
jgi:hypothetical protein